MKVQMRFQKILAIVSLVIAALTIVLAFGFFSGNLSDLLYYSAKKQGDVDIVGADSFVVTAQGFNNALYIFGIIYLLVIVTLFITASNRRRNYYITNYISVIACAAVGLAMAIFLITMAAVCMSAFKDIPWDRVVEYYSAVNPDSGTQLHAGAPEVSQSYANFAIVIVMAVIVLADVAALVLNLLWKIKLMQGEKKLLEGSLVKEVA